MRGWIVGRRCLGGGGGGERAVREGEGEGEGMSVCEFFFFWIFGKLFGAGGVWMLWFVWNFGGLISFEVFGLEFHAFLFSFYLDFWVFVVGGRGGLFRVMVGLFVCLFGEE